MIHTVVNDECHERCFKSEMLVTTLLMGSNWSDYIYANLYGGVGPRVEYPPLRCQVVYVSATLPPGIKDGLTKDQQATAVTMQPDKGHTAKWSRKTEYIDVVRSPAVGKTNEPMERSIEILIEAFDGQKSKFQ